MKFEGNWSKLVLLSNRLAMKEKTKLIASIILVFCANEGCLLLRRGLKNFFCPCGALSRIATVATSTHTCRRLLHQNHRLCWMILHQNHRLIFKINIHRSCWGKFSPQQGTSSLSNFA
ncbi:uncharacterized protein LOC127144517 [Cucumis melo]|uniref:Uncharacterized protein LOC127144517 n=1 Tax=Cucumis melo TaxID=3656 RepID=A0ABM3KFM0_CUCME|nr:uncharacterized protein LOC127144517 [Cucumis melo]